MYKYPGAVIMVFCKAPIPGQVETRLIAPLTGQEAARLHCELTELTLQTATQNNLCEVQLWCSPTFEHPFFMVLAQKYAIRLRLQQGADLGGRMHHAFAQALSHKRSAIIIGCDCPSLTNDDLNQALSLLEDGEECVLTPAEDGGYVMVGLNNPQPALFENMPWGTNMVLELTRGRLHSLNLQHKELPTQWDLDTEYDLRRYLELKRP